MGGSYTLIKKETAYMKNIRIYFARRMRLESESILPAQPTAASTIITPQNTYQSMGTTLLVKPAASEAVLLHNTGGGTTPHVSAQG